MDAPSWLFISSSSSCSVVNKIIAVCSSQNISIIRFSGALINEPSVESGKLMKLFSFLVDIIFVIRSHKFCTTQSIYSFFRITEADVLIFWQDYIPFSTIPRSCEAFQTLNIRNIPKYLYMFNMNPDPPAISLIIENCSASISGMLFLNYYLLNQILFQTFQLLNNGN